MNENQTYNILLIVSIIVLVNISIIGCTKQPGKYDSLAQCLTTQGAIMYGTSWCSHCQNQKKTFGTSFDYVTFIDCDKNAAECQAAGIEGYPTWVINGTKYAGEQNFYTLAKNSGCIAKLTTT